MLAIDLGEVLVLLFQKSILIKRNNQKILTGITVGTIMQHLYCVIVFGLINRPIPIECYAGIDVLDQLTLSDVMTNRELKWFLSRTLTHTLLQQCEVLNVIIVGQHGVISYKNDQ